MTLTLAIYDSWLSHPAALAEFMRRCKALEGPAESLATAPSPSPAPQPNSAGDDDLGELLDGLDTPELATPAPAPATRTLAPAPIPRSGQALYRWACGRDLLPAVHAIGKRKGWPKMLTQWSQDRVATAYAELTAQTAANSQALG
jgi:hypothetical protein